MSATELWQFATIAIVVSGIFFMLGQALESRLWRRECIDRGHGRYNPQTGIWEWTEQGTETRQ